MRRLWITLCVIIISLVSLPVPVLGSSMGFDSKYRNGLTTSSRDSEVYVPISPVDVIAGNNGNPITIEQGLSAGVDGPEYGQSAELSINGQRLVESLHFKQGTTEITGELTDALAGIGSPLGIGIVSSNLYNGKYLMISIDDWSKGVNLTSMFAAAQGELDILELNFGKHGFEIGGVNVGGQVQYYMIPKTSKPGYMELLLCDSLLVAIGASAPVEPKQFSDLPLLYSSLDETPVLVYNEESATVTESTSTDETTSPFSATVEVSMTNEEFAMPEEYIPLLKPGAEQRYQELIDMGAPVEAAIKVLQDEDLMYEDEYEALNSRLGQEEEDDHKYSSSGSEVDDFFREAGISNVLDEMGRPSGFNSSTSLFGDMGEYDYSGDTPAQLDLSQVNLDPITWGVSIRDGSSFAEVMGEGDELIADWSDQMEINITSLTGKAHEFVQKKAVRPKPIIPIVPSEVEVEGVNMFIPMVMILAAAGLGVLYFIIVNTYVVAGRKRIKRAEIEALKTIGGTQIGDLDSFEIS